MHLTDRELETLADGELRSPGGESAHRHVAECAVCAEALARREARNREVAALLWAVDHALPVASSDLLIARATRVPRSRWRAMAAGIAAAGVAVVGAAAAIPNSPLRVYLRRLAKTEGAASAVQQSPEPSASSLAFASANVVNVIFTSMQPSGEIEVTLGDSAVVRVAHRAGSVSYLLTADGVLIDNGGSRASYEVTVPRASASVRIRVGSRVIFTHAGGHLWTVTSPNREGRYLIRFAALMVPAR
jgi:hypothetical protein